MKKDVFTQHEFKKRMKAARQHITETTYTRGLSKTTLAHFNIGYEAGMLLLPVSDDSCMLRYTDENAEPRYQWIGNANIFNPSALFQNKKPIAVVEGIFDAMSVFEAGGEAVALTSTSQVKRFLDIVKKNRPNQLLILALDHDDAGQKAQAELVEKLEALNIPYTEKIDLIGKYKDCNEFLMNDKSGFFKAVESGNNAVKALICEHKEEKQTKLNQLSFRGLMPEFNDSVTNGSATSLLETGIKTLDDLLDGGLREGLYIIGGSSSLGKTSLCLQIADQLAESGHDVLFFSLETDIKELMAKCISRTTMLYDLQTTHTTQNAKTTNGILDGFRYSKYSPYERKLITDAMNTYEEEKGSHLFFFDTDANLRIEDIEQRVKEHIDGFGRLPVVMIDYLQFMAGETDYTTAKQNIDKFVSKLKNLRREFKIPVIAISSFNRTSYASPVSKTSFKESGSIEYGADFLIGLQLYGMDREIDENDKAFANRVRTLVQKSEESVHNGGPRVIQLKLLKNRNGDLGSCKLLFYPRFNCFLEEASPALSSPQAAIPRGADDDFDDVADF